MEYILDIPETAQQEIRKKLEPYLIERLDKRIQKLKIEPTVYGKPLRYPLAGIWEIRFENRWRVLYRIDESRKIVQILGIRHKDEM